VTQETVGGMTRSEAIPASGYYLVLLWTLGLAFLYVAGGYSGLRALKRYKAEEEALRRGFMESASVEPTTIAPPDPDLLHKVGETRVGLYVNRIAQWSTAESSWTADCDVWFRWSDARIKPGETFQIVNGEIAQRDKIEAYSHEGEQYERYRLKIQLTHFFDSSRFPFGDEGLAIKIEDPTLGVDRMNYVADEQGSGMDPLGNPPQVSISKWVATVKYHAIEGARGAPRAVADGARVRSRFVFAVLASPPGWSLYLRMFQALQGAVAIAFIAFFLKPIYVDPRFGLGVGAAFAAIANNIVVASYFPAARRFALTNMVSALGLGTIFLTLVESTIALYVYDSLGLTKLRTLLDRASFVILFIGYATLTVLWSFAAMP
jgi:hypothetical protein